MLLYILVVIELSIALHCLLILDVLVTENFISNKNLKFKITKNRSTNNKNNNLKI